MTRVFVTGLGAVSPIGNDVPTFWKNLTDGVSGAGQITAFDASDFPVRIGCEVKDFDPSLWMDRKMAKVFTGGQPAGVSRCWLDHRRKQP
jgi:3-oxoacyl-[acyl-carrier-protein] synthase II